MKSQGREGIRRVTKSNQPFLDMPTLESLEKHPLPVVVRRFNNDSICKLSQYSRAK